MISPPYLKPGDTVGIVATASYISIEDVEKSIPVLESWGLKIKVGKLIGNRHHQFAGTDKDRLGEFQEMLDDKDIKAILCARGGYGTVRIIDKIDFSNFLKSPKWLIGFSDITVLNSHINNLLNVQSIHGPVPKTFYKSVASNNYLKDALFGKLKSYEIQYHKLNYSYLL